MARAIKSVAVAAAVAAAAAVACVRAEWTVVAQRALLFGVGAHNKTVLMTGSEDNSGTDIFRSDDGGLTWVNQPHDQQALYLSVDTSDGVHGGAGSLGFWGQTAAGSVTSDGEVWTAIDYVPLFSSAQSVTTVGNVSYFVGFWMDSWNSTYGDGIMVSKDDGAIFERHPWNQAYGARYGSFPTADTWFVSGGTWPAKKSNTQSVRDGVREVNERFAIRQTADKHVSWQYRVPAAAPKGDRDAREPGYEGIIARTTNGGQSFETVYADSSRLYFNGIDCPTVTNCWAVAEGPEGGWIFATSDAGATWTEQFFYATGGFFQVKMLNAREGWAAGGVYKQNTFDALFVSTRDGGVTWVAEPVIPNAVANALDLVTMDNAYATTFLRVGGSSLMAYNA